MSCFKVLRGLRSPVNELEDRFLYTSRAQELGIGHMTSAGYPITRKLDVTSKEGG